MFVCICHAVTDEQVHDALDAGAMSVAEIGRATGAGSSCGSCHDHVEDLVEARCGACPLAGLVA
ncbi:bacterioferritin-associated ferredoxin [uncultured Jatrophihabitans sp.]|uniref:(2Fe-2S)-binding protein n=1 Tax=uncultured Jatrophihabitans sp. TaxID=1610747 RepID=UPI0035C9B3C1